MFSQMEIVPVEISRVQHWAEICPDVYGYFTVWMERTVDGMGRQRVKLEGYVEKVSSVDGLTFWAINIPDPTGVRISIIDHKFDLVAAKRWMEFMAAPDEKELVAPAT
jgi:hypothetical protein